MLRGKSASGSAAGAARVRRGPPSGERDTIASMMRTTLLGLTALVALVAFSSVSTAADARAMSESRLIRAAATFQRLGDWRIDRASTLQGAIDGLGAPSSCRALERGHATARWASTGVTVDLWTYGSLPAGQTGCDAPELIHVNYVRVTGRVWTTSLGLHVGDPATKLRRLYPRAVQNPRGAWPRASAWWLVTRRTICLGSCSTTYVTVPQLLAEVGRGRVVAFFFHVGAQGE